MAGRFKKNEIDYVWKQISDPASPDRLDHYQFKKHFEGLPYQGLALVKSTVSVSTGMKS